MKDIDISPPKDLQDIINDWNVEQKCVVCGFPNEKVTFEWERRGCPAFFCFPIAHDHTGVKQVTEMDIPQT
jgi:hypothetical protein